MSKIKSERNFSGIKNRVIPLVLPIICTLLAKIGGIFGEDNRVTQTDGR